MNDYNPYGGTSQSVINDYHRQMADIDRQLYETGRYVGPVYDPKTKSVEIKELNKAQAIKLKNSLWNQADKLEGYAMSERHQKGPLRAIGAWLIRKIKGLNPIYQIRRLIAWRDQRKLEGNPYARDLLYGMTPPPETPSPEAPVNEQSEKAPQPPSRDNDPKTPVTPPDPKKEPKSKDQNEKKKEQDKDQKTPQETPQKPDKPKEKPDYQAKFYEELNERMTESGMTKEDSIISMIEEKPIRYLNLKEEDITKNIATKAVIAYAAEKQQTPIKAYLYLSSRVPKTAVADTRAKGMEDTFKAVPTLIEKTPETLKYLSPAQITKNTAQFLVSDIISHAQKDGKDPIEAQEQYRAQLTKISSPAADKLKEHLEAMAPPSRNPQVKSWRQDQILSEKAAQIEDMCESELSCYPPSVRDNVILERVITNNPELYDRIPESERTLQVSALAVLKDPWQIIEVPEEISLKQILDLAPEITKNWSVQEIDRIVNEATNDTSAPIMDEVKEITQAMSQIATEKAEKQPVQTKPPFMH